MGSSRLRIGHGSQAGLLFDGVDYLMNLWWSGAVLPPSYPMTYFWRARVDDKGLNYSTFFFDGTSDGFFSQTEQYYGAAPYPNGLGTTIGPPPDANEEYPEIAIGGGDELGSNELSYGAPGGLGYGNWWDMAFRAFVSGANKVHEFYFDLSDLSRVITVSLPSSYYSSPPSNRVISFGGAPWDHVNSDSVNETLKGVLRKIGMWRGVLTTTQLQNQRNQETPITTSDIHYWNPNPTPTDIADRSGEDNHPQWRDDAHKPALWTP